MVIWVNWKCLGFQLRGLGSKVTTLYVTRRTTQPKLSKLFYKINGTLLTKKWFRTYIYTKQMHLWLQPGKIRIHFKRIYFLFETISEETILDSFSVSILNPREDYSLCEWLLRLPSKKLRSSPAHLYYSRSIIPRQRRLNAQHFATCPQALFYSVPADFLTDR